MTDNQINYIGFAVLAVLFWYIQIYRPRKKILLPGELRVKSVMDSGAFDMYEAIKSVFPRSFIIVSNVGLDDLLHSPDLDKKPHFHKEMQMHVLSWLVLDEKKTPFLAVDYSEKGEDMKLRYLTQAGIGYCMFTPGSSITQMQAELQEALTVLQDMHNTSQKETEAS